MAQLEGYFKAFEILEKEIGSGGRIRTYDQRINSPLRYRCATPEYAISEEKIGRLLSSRTPLTKQAAPVRWVAYNTGSAGCKSLDAVSRHFPDHPFCKRAGKGVRAGQPVNVPRCRL